MAIDKKYGDVKVKDDSENNPLNKSDEPVFILRAQDSFAMAILSRYENMARQVETGEVSPEFLEKLEEARAAFDQWRAENPDKIKIPT
jgi:hypothetical protein